MSTKPHPVIIRLRVKNFRSLADVDVSLEPLTIFVGQNGSGKSTIIDALRFMRDAISRDLDAAIMDRGGMSAVRRWSAKGRPYDVTMQVDLRYGDPDQSALQEGADTAWTASYGFTLGSESRGEFRVKWERLEIQYRGQPAQVLEVRDNELIDFPSNLIELATQRLPFGGSRPTAASGLGLPRLASLLTSPTTTAEGELALASSSNPVFEFLRSASFYTIYPDALREPQKPANPYPLGERGQNLATVLRELKRAKTADFSDNLRDALVRVVEGVHDYSVRQVGGYLVTNLHHTVAEDGRQGPAFELAQESDGTLRMLGILTALYQEPPRPLLTIEEPELTIHPGALGVLCDVLAEASMRSQVLITTHNPDLIDHFSTDLLRIVAKTYGVTQIGQISANQRNAVAERLFSPGELMRIDGLRFERDVSVVES